jgi:hypothetical protein
VRGTAPRRQQPPRRLRPSAWLQCESKAAASGGRDSGREVGEGMEEFCREKGRGVCAWSVITGREVVEGTAHLKRLTVSGLAARRLLSHFS